MATKKKPAPRKKKPPVSQFHQEKLDLLGVINASWVPLVVRNIEATEALASSQAAVAKGLESIAKAITVAKKGG
jgi:hypothetical protein